MNYRITKSVALLSFLAIFGYFGMVRAASITVSPPKFEIDAQPGQTVSQEIVVTNGDATPLTLTVSAADFTASGEEGKASFIEGENTSAFSMSSWLGLPKEAIVVPPGGKFTMPFSIAVPAGAEAGGHFGTIFFTPVTPREGTIAIQQKVGVLLLVKVAGEIREQGQLEIFDSYGADVAGEAVATAKSQHFFEKFPLNFAVRFTNSGNVHTKPQGKIILRNTFGQTLGRVGEQAILTPTGAVTGSELVDYIPVNDRGGNVLPQSSRVFLQPWKGYGSFTVNQNSQREIVWKGLGFGRYSAELELSYGKNSLPKQIISFWIIPWKIVLAVLVILAGLYFGIGQWRQMSRERLKKQLRKEIEREGV